MKLGIEFFFTVIKSFGGFTFKLLPNFLLKDELFLSLSATCHGSHRDEEAALEYLDFLDENEPLDRAGMIADDDGRTSLLPSDGGLEISGTEGETEAKSSDLKSLATRVTRAMLGCAFLEVHIEENMFTKFGDVDSIENVLDESVEQEGPLGEPEDEDKVEHKVVEEALVVETLLTGPLPTWTAAMFNHSPGTL